MIVGFEIIWFKSRTTNAFWGRNRRAQIFITKSQKSLLLLTIRHKKVFEFSNYSFGFALKQKYF
jgi:hypothetical protein